MRNPATKTPSRAGTVFSAAGPAVMPRVLYPGYQILVLLDAGVEALAGGGVTGDVVRGVDVELHIALLENLGDRADGHPYGGDEGHRGERADLVEFLLHLDGSVLERAAGVDHVVGDLEEVLAAGVAGHLVAGLGGGSEDDHLHSEAFGFEGDVDIDGVDAGVREDPHDVFLLEVPTAHDGLAVTLGPFEPEELVDTHFTDDVGEEGQREFADGVEADETADAGIHLLDRQVRVAAAEGVDHVSRLDAVGHKGRHLLDFLHLSLLNLVHHAKGVLFPFVCVHSAGVLICYSCWID